MKPARATRRCARKSNRCWLIRTRPFIESPAFQVAAELLTDEQLRLVEGQQLGPYKIAGPLGAGGMGEVYRARDARLGRDVAIKVLPSAFSDHPERLRRFEQEARAAGLLNHPNILTIYDVGTHEGLPYVVSELFCHSSR